MTSISIVSQVSHPRQARLSLARFAIWRRRQLEHPDLHTLNQDPAALPRFVQKSAVAMRYLRLLGPLAWGCFPERDLETNWGAPTMPYAPFVAACLVKLDQHLPYMSHLRRYLVEHPALGGR